MLAEFILTFICGGLFVLGLLIMFVVWYNKKK